LPKAECKTPCATGEIRSDVEFRATGSLHILLAEDIPENIELAKLRLTRVGHRVSVAKNGLEAVYMVGKKKEMFHLILMDVHMPKMDGLEASRQIRKLEKETGDHIPIIALSASVLEKEKAYCQEAGMDGFVGKPIDFTELFAEISRVVPKDAGSPLDDLKISYEQQHKDDLPSHLPGLDIKSGISLWRDTKAYLNNLQYFIKKHGIDGERIQQALTENDLKTAEAISHSLKGVAGNLGMPDVAATAGALNSVLKEQSKKYQLELQALISTLDIAAQSVQLLNNQQAEQEEDVFLPELEPDTIKETLYNLLHALDQDDLDRIETLLEQMKGSFPELLLSTLNQQIADFEFRAAEDSLKKVAAHLNIDLVHRNNKPRPPSKRG
ncbi:MAG: response regulator, partial [Candidatus Electrothrix sp. ATG2]|nr:response regulator [Candidatus Electrothrix sp. ATG2]